MKRLEVVVQLQELSVAHNRKNKKNQQLLDDFIELGQKCDVKIIHDKGDFNGDTCLLFSDNIVVINKHKPDFIVPEVEAIETNVLIDAEQNGYNVIPSAKAVNLTMNRDAIRDRANELGIKTANYKYAYNKLKILIMKTIFDFSPNYSEKPRIIRDIKFIIIHYTGMQSERESIKKLCKLFSTCVSPSYCSLQLCTTKAHLPSFTHSIIIGSMFVK